MSYYDDEKVKIADEYSKKITGQIITEIQDYESNSINLSERAVYSQHRIIQDILTHQNKEFLTPLIAGQENDREFYDIISPMIETAVSNIDLDTDNIQPYADNPEHSAQEYVARILIRNFLRQTNHGEVLNDTLYQFVDDGNIIVRKVADKGEIYRPVLPQNLYVIDQAARTLEDTTVIEKQIMNQSEVRDMKDWGNKDKVFSMCLMNGTKIPYYEVFYRYGEISKMELGYIKQEVHNQKYEYKEGDEKVFVHSLVAMARATTEEKDELDNRVQGIVVFAEELKPEEIKITGKLKIKRHKPYESARLGKFNGRFWGEGYREKGMPYQNRANEIGNQLRKIMEHAATMAWWSDDDTIGGKNILSSVKRGQIIQVKAGRTLNVLNNTFPNFSLFVSEWNRNIRECEKTLKSFEVATGESLPSSTSATAVSIQNQAVGKYYNFKREKFGLFISSVFKRFVMKELLDLKEDETIELLGDISTLEEIAEAYTKGWLLKNYLKTVALAGGTITKQSWENLKEMKKQEILKKPKNYITVFKDFFKDVELYVGINTTGEGFNKQAKISNMLALLAYETNPAIQSNPDIMDTVNDIKQMLGLKPVKQRPAMPTADMPSPSLPMKEPTEESTDNVGVV